MGSVWAQRASNPELMGRELTLGMPMMALQRVTEVSAPQGMKLGTVRSRTGQDYGLWELEAASAPGGR